MAINDYKVYSKNPMAQLHYQSFVGEPLCAQLQNNVEHKLREYFNDGKMNLDAFKDLCEKNQSHCALSYISTHIGFFKNNDPNRVLYHLGLQLNSNSALEKLDSYLEKELQKRVPAHAPTVTL